MGLLSRNEAHLFNGLASTTKGNSVALMAILLDAIGIDMHHQGTDLAAGTGGDRHGRNGVGHPPCASRPSGCMDCDSSPARSLLPLGWGAVWKGAHGVALAITEGLKAESKLVSMGPVAGEWPGASDPPWFEARALGCAFR